ncbi:hypothetical protein ACFX16_034510 [Malus domestica]
MGMIGRSGNRLNPKKLSLRPPRPRLLGSPGWRGVWKTLGIFITIKLSIIEINMDRELLMAALSFCCVATNTMVLPLGPIGLTVLDVTTILGTSPSGLPVDVAISWYQFELDLKAVFEERAVEALSKDGQEPLKENVHKQHKNFFNYSTLITHFAGLEGETLKNDEYEAFLFYWYNKFIFCTKSIKCLAGNKPVVEALASGHILTFNSAIFANLTRCLAKAFVRKIDLHQNSFV